MIPQSPPPAQKRVPRSAWMFLFAAIASEVTGSLSLKGALDRPALYLLVVTGFVLAFVFLAQVLRRGLPIGVAYGIWGAAGVAATAILSTLIYGEPFSALMGVGIVLVIAGVVLIELGGNNAEGEESASTSANRGSE